MARAGEGDGTQLAESRFGMTRLTAWYGTSVGKKIAMALTGILLVLYVVVHMLENLRLYQGPEHLNAYAEFLRDAGAPVLGPGELLWFARLVLLTAVVIHVVAAIQLARMSRRARPVGYRNPPHDELSYASRTMRWGGVVIFLFVVYHVLHLTLGSVHPDYVPGDVYRNVVVGFRSWPVSVAYMLAMVALGLHLYHGIWSMTQTLGVDHPRVDRLRRPVAAVIAGAVMIGNLSFPVAVLAGWVGLSG